MRTRQQAAGPTGPAHAGVAAVTAVTAGTVVDGETRIASAALTTVAADAAGPAVANQ